MKYINIKIQIAFIASVLLLFIKVVNLLRDDILYTLKSFITCLAGVLCIYSACSTLNPGSKIANMNIIYVIHVITFFLLLATKKRKKDCQQKGIPYYTNCTNIFQFVKLVNDWNNHPERYIMIDRDIE